MRTAFIIIFFLFLAVGFAAADRSLKVDVIVADYLEPQIRTALNQYIHDLELYGHTATLTIWTSGDKWALRDHLRAEWEAGELDGATLIGNLPTAWFESEWVQRRGDPAWNGVWFYRADATFPTDHFFTDLDGEWLDTDHNGYFDTHQDGSGDVTPEIWVGRIWTSTLGNEASIVRAYLDRVHRWKWGNLTFRDQALLYADDDWSGGNASDWENEMRLAFDHVTKVDDPYTTWRDDWISRITEQGGWKMAHLCSHSWPGGHGFKRGEDWSWVYSQDIPSINPKVGFFNFFDCSFARYTESGYGAGMYVFRTNWGLGGVGSTKTGGMYNGSSFYSVLGRGGCLGEAFKNWWTTIGADGYDEGEINWWYGMVVIGDPTLCPNRQPHRIYSPAGFVKVGWNWLSVPAQPLDPSVNAVFGGASVANRLFQYDPVDKNMELYPDDFDTMDLGRGYMLFDENECWMDYAGWPTESPARVELPRAGWTWIGQPFDTETPQVGLSVWGPGQCPILTDDFNDGAADGWYVWFGPWCVESGWFVQRSNHTFFDCKTSAGPEARDFHMEGTVCLQGLHGDAGFMLRASNISAGEGAFDGYYVGLAPDRDAVVFGKSSNSYCELAAFPKTIDPGVPYLLAVTASGPVFQIYLNGEKLGEVVDSDYASGKLGLRTSWVSCAYDNIAVTALNGVRTALEDFTAPDPWVNWNFVYWDADQRTMRILSWAGGDDNMLRPWQGYGVWSYIDGLWLEFKRP